ncbi:MAG: WbqC family protein [Bacteroidota bacterium]|nr:WbqC family protein [Bacteroidota bacterium]
MKIVLGSAYWPNIQYLYYVLNADSIYIDLHEHYQKQSYRNRTKILSANGELSLSIPVKKFAEHAPVKDIEISYSEDWQKQHWRSITSAYKNSPYFDFLEDELRSFYDREHKFLHEYNAEQLKWIIKAFRLKKDIKHSDVYVEDETLMDLREEIHPKKEINDKPLKELLEKSYYQTFSDKMSFAPNLSVLDLIFNEGIKSHKYLII